MKTPTEIIGIDVGLARPACAALDPKTGKLLRVSAFSGEAGPELDMSVRAHGIALLIAQYVADVPGPKVIGIEGPAYNVRNRSAMEQLARCRQALFSTLVFTLPDLLHFEIPPASAKLALTGKGNADKPTVCEAVIKTFGVTLSTSKISKYAQADAICIAHCTYNRWRRAFP